MSEIKTEIADALTAEALRFNAAQQDFADEFGFEHLCTCDKDYAEGRTTEVTECFTQLASDALETCRTLKRTNDELKKIAESAVEALREDVDAGTGQEGS